MACCAAYFGHVYLVMKTSTHAAVREAFRLSDTTASKSAHHSIVHPQSCVAFNCKIASARSFSVFALVLAAHSLIRNGLIHFNRPDKLKALAIGDYSTHYTNGAAVCWLRMMRTKEFVASPTALSRGVRFASGVCRRRRSTSFGNTFGPYTRSDRCQYGCNAWRPERPEATRKCTKTCLTSLPKMLQRIRAQPTEPHVFGG